MKLWQFKKISTNENIGAPQRLPIHWGPIFGMRNITEKLGDLTWLSDPELADKGWFETDIDDPGTGESAVADLVWQRAKDLLQDSDWSMLSDVAMTVGDKELWISYRRSLREIRLQSGFPNEIVWPSKPS